MIRPEIETSLVEARAIFLDDLKMRVEEAFKNQEIVELTEDKSQIVERLKLIANGQDFNYHVPCVVSVENSHDYRDLLLMSLETIGIKDDEALEEANRILVHEFEHHVPLIGNDLVKALRYGVRFVKDRDTGRVGFQPTIIFSDIPVWLQIKSLESVSCPSVSDEVTLAALNKRGGVWKRLAGKLKPFNHLDYL